MQYSNLFSRNFHKRRHLIKQRVKLGPLFLSIISLILIGLCGFFYLSQANQIATRGIEIERLEERLRALQEEQKRLRFQRAELESLKNLEERARELNMVPVEKIVYLGGGKKNVAMKGVEVKE